MRYLFSCQCGQKHSVETHQAGQMIRCSCGKQIELPTMRQILQLEQEANATPTRKRSSWNVRRRLTVLGVVSLMVSLALGITVWLLWPSPPVRVYNATKVHQDTMALTPLQSMKLWEMVIHVPLGRLNSKTASPEMLAAYQQKRARGESFAVVAAVMGVVALGMLVGAMMVPSSRPMD